MDEYYLIKDLNGNLSISEYFPLYHEGKFYSVERYIIDGETVRPQTIQEHRDFILKNRSLHCKMVHWNWEVIKEMGEDMNPGTYKTLQSQ